MAETATLKKPEKKAPTVKSVQSSASDKSGKFTHAVFTTGGKQYRVMAGDLVKIEKMKGEYKEGDKIAFDKVLLKDDGEASIELGEPFIQGAEVQTTLNKIGRYKTIDVIKYKQKSRYFKKYGHRQPYFEIKIDSIK